MQTYFDKNAEQSSSRDAFLQETEVRQMKAESIVLRTSDESTTHNEEKKRENGS